MPLLRTFFRQRLTAMKDLEMGGLLTAASAYTNARYETEFEEIGRARFSDQQQF